MNNRTNCIIKSRVTMEQIYSELEKSDSFQNILKELTLIVNPDGKGSSISDLEGNKMNNIQLERIYRSTKKILKANLSYIEFIDILRDLIFDRLEKEDPETFEFLNNESNLILRGTSFLEGNENNLAGILANLNEDYFKYETICSLLKENFGIEISTKDTRLAKFLTDLGYKKIRKRIEGKQQNVWVK